MSVSSPSPAPTLGFAPTAASTSPAPTAASAPPATCCMRTAAPARVRAGSTPRDQGVQRGAAGTAPLAPCHCHRCERVHREAAQLHPGRPLHQHLRGAPLRAPQVPPPAPQHQLRQDLCLVSDASQAVPSYPWDRSCAALGTDVVSPRGRRERASQTAPWGMLGTLAKGLGMPGNGGVGRSTPTYGGFMQGHSPPKP